MKFKKVIKHFCFRCGSRLFKEKELDYPFFCEKCDENMYGFEAEKISYKRNKKIFKNR